MEQTTNLKLGKPLSSEKYDVAVFNGNADILDSNIGNLNNHSNNSNIHVSVEEKAKWNEASNYTVITNEQIDALFD